MRSRVILIVGVKGVPTPFLIKLDKLYCRGEWKALEKMIVQKKLEILKEVIPKFGLWLKEVFVTSEKNKVDAPTRVNKK